ncbi:MAG: PrsW family glutamic-type intramembrane protease, partial [Thermoplasmata archaeon]
MTASLDVESLLLLILAALLPAFVYLIWVRTTEFGQKEGWGVVLKCFAYGAFFATIVAAVLEAVLVGEGTAFSQAIPAPEFVFLNGNTSAGEFFLILVAAPFIEEALKASGVYTYRGNIRSIADGAVLGASVGLGFGFFETFLYGLGAFVTGGLVAGLALIVLRSVSSVLLHGSSTAFFGYGYAESRVTGRGQGGSTHYLGAVGLHGGFNAVVSLGSFAAFFGLTGNVSGGLTLAGFALGVLLAFLAIEYVRRLIVQSSYPGALAAHPR